MRLCLFVALQLRSGNNKVSRKKNKGKNGGRSGGNSRGEKSSRLHPATKKNIWVVALLGVATILILAATGEAGPAGRGFFNLSRDLLGVGYYLLPAVAFLFALSFVRTEAGGFLAVTFFGGALFVLAGLGFLDVVSSGKGGLAGSLVGAVETPFGAPASLVVLGSLIIVSFLVILNRPFDFSRFFAGREKKKKESGELMIKMPETSAAAGGAKEEIDEKTKKKETEKEPPKDNSANI